MLNKLSFRNAKRQFKEYILYFVTLACTVSIMYAFNTLIFSDVVKELSSLEILPYMITAASLLIVIIMGWIISYMTGYMLRKRSREFSIYMISGISNSSVNALVFRENILIGLLAFLIGLPIGILLSQLLEAIVFHMFGRIYILSFQFSIMPVVLTFLYFLIMLWYSVRKNRKWIKKLKLYDLLYFDRKNENELLQGNASTITVFTVSILLGGVGIFLMYAQPIGKGLDVLVGTFFLLLFLFGFFLSVPTYLVIMIGDHLDWKYKKNRLIPFRGFTQKIQSMTVVMGMLSILFMLSIAFWGIGAAVNRMANKNIEMSPFDIMILHKEELADFSSYDNLLKSNFPIRESYSYGIYTDSKNNFLTIRDYTITESGRENSLVYAEFQHDTYMRQSDYIKLREMLKLDIVELNSNCCYIHCLPALKNNFKTYIREQREYLDSEGYCFSEDGIFTEPFYQIEAYGNGLNYIIVIPDQAINEMKILYSLYAAVADTSFNSYDLDRILDECVGLVKLDRSVGKSVSISNGYTSLITNNDYLFGKWIEKGSLSHLYAMSICLFYLAFVLEIIGVAILAIQILSDREKKCRQDRILQQLGMENKHVDRIKSIQLLMIFMIPALPSLIVASCFVYVCAKKMQISAFYLPLFENNCWIIQSFCNSTIFFALLYCIYYAATRISYGKCDMRNMSQ